MKLKIVKIIKELMFIQILKKMKMKNKKDKVLIVIIKKVLLSKD